MHFSSAVVFSLLSSLGVSYAVPFKHTPPANAAVIRRQDPSVSVVNVAGDPPATSPPAAAAATTTTTVTVTHAAGAPTVTVTHTVTPSIAPACPLNASTVHVLAGTFSTMTSGPGETPVFPGETHAIHASSPGVVRRMLHPFRSVNPTDSNALDAHAGDGAHGGSL